MNVTIQRVHANGSAVERGRYLKYASTCNPDEILVTICDAGSDGAADGNAIGYRDKEHNVNLYHCDCLYVDCDEFGRPIDPDWNYTP